MSTYFVQGSTMDAIADAINAKTGGSSAMTPAQMVTAIGSISGGGTAITDGIVIKARNANGYPTEIDIYGDLWQAALSFDGEYYHDSAGTKSITTINLKTSQTSLPSCCFYGLTSLNTLNGAENVTSVGARALSNTNFINIYLPNVTTLQSNNPFGQCKSLETVNLPSATGALNSGTYPVFHNDTALTSVILGSVGHACWVSYSGNPFNGCTQNGLTITLYTLAEYVDNSLARIRNGATNATIIIKASEATTYNGTSYAAGDIIITSEVTP